MAKETLKNAPGVDRHSWPDMTLPEWHVETHFAYNLYDETQAVKSGEFIGSGANSTAVELNLKVSKAA